MLATEAIPYSEIWTSSFFLTGSVLLLLEKKKKGEKDRMSLRSYIVRQMMIVWNFCCETGGPRPINPSRIS